MDRRAELCAALEQSFRLEPGPAKEREINRIVVELIVALVRAAEPDAAEVWLDWDQSGLAVMSICDCGGEPMIDPEDVDADLQTLASNIQNQRHTPGLVAVRGNHGPFAVFI